MMPCFINFGSTAAIQAHDLFGHFTLVCSFFDKISEGPDSFLPPLYVSTYLLRFPVTL